MTAAMPAGLWLNDYLTPADAVCLPLAPGWAETEGQDVDVQEFAGGTFRAIYEVGDQLVLTPKFRLMGPALVAQVKRRKKRQQWVRTSTGLRFTAIYATPQITWTSGAAGGLAQVTLTFTEISSLEVV